MSRWTLQTVRVGGGCDSIPRRLSYRITPAVTPLRGAAAASSDPRYATPSYHLLRPRAPDVTPSSWRYPIRHSSTTSGPLRSGTTYPVASVTSDALVEDVGQGEEEGSVSPDSADRTFREEPHHSSMSQLRIFLDSETLHDDSRRYTARQIRHRYLLWKRERFLEDLGSYYLSSIVCLLGSLSISSPGVPPSAPYAQRRVLDMPEPSFEPHWDMVISICKDKQRLRYPLLPSDHYWLMRARIAKFQECAEPDRTLSERLLSAAGRCYEVVLDSSPHPELHLPYLQALLSKPSEERMQEFAVHAAAIFARFDWIHPSIRRFFFHSVVSHTRVTAASKQEILLALSKRVASDKSPVVVTPDNPYSPPTLAIQDARGLVVILEHAIFGNIAPTGSPSDSPDSVLLQWARVVVRRVFTVTEEGHSQDHTDDTRWNCLILLALVRTRTAEWSGDSAGASSNPLRRAAVMEWQTVCILAAVENLLYTGGSSADNSLPLDVIQGFCGVLRKLWGDWTAIPPASAPPRPPYVSRLICASFLKLAGRLEDKVLLDSCREYCATAKLWFFHEDKPETAAGLRKLATEQLYAALKCGTFFERALVDLVVCTTDMCILTSAVDTAVSRYALVDPEHAQELIAWARNRGIAPSGKAVMRVGVALARSGTSSYSDRYLNHPSLSAEQRALVVMAYLHAFVAHGRRFMEPRTAADVCSTAVALSTRVVEPGPLLGIMQSALLVLIREGYAARAVALVTDLAANRPSGVSKATFSDLLSALLRHRQFKLARRVLGRCASLFPDKASEWQTVVALQSARGGAHRLAASSRIPQPLRSAALSSSRARRLGRLATTSTLRLPAFYGTTADPALALHALQALVRVGRLHAAKKLYERVVQQESLEVRTISGNMILDGVTSRTSRGQRIRAMAYTYRTLSEKYAFVPDRVTVNVLFKALLSDKDLDAARARALFGTVVRMGFPIGARRGQAAEDNTAAPPSSPRTRASPPLFVGDVEVPRLTSPIMYMRHARPLYKTFIKAFYGLGDVDAARKVVNILNTLEAENAQRVVEGKDWVVGGGERG